MKLLTYRINQKSGTLNTKRYFVYRLYNNFLIKDPLWHYFLDPGGVTLRFSPNMEARVKKWMDKNKEKEFTYRKAGDYVPRRAEYYGIAYLGDDLIPFFHVISTLTIIYPAPVIIGPFLERLTHAMVNQAGIHNFAYESDLYMGLAMGRARLVNYPLLRLPRAIYRWYVKYFRTFGDGKKK